jgi:fatty acid/phospholipid biosynthesis enzyme
MANGKIISIDAMGGDHAPRIVVEGLERFAQRQRSSTSCCMATRRAEGAARQSAPRCAAHN